MLGINGRAFNLSGGPDLHDISKDTNVTHFKKLERKDPEGFDPLEGLQPSSVPGIITRTNPLLIHMSQADIDQLEDSLDGSMRSLDDKLDVAEMNRKSFWFKTQQDRDDSIIEARAEVFQDDISDGTSSQVYCIEGHTSSYT